MQRPPQSAEFPEVDMDLPLEQPPPAREDGDMMDIDIAPLSPILSEPPQWRDMRDWVLEPQRGRRRNTSEDSIGKPQEDAGTTTTCCACLDMSDPLITSSCGCRYCISCFNGYVETGLANRGSFPPKCCGQEIGLGAAREYLYPKVLKRYEEVREEFGSKNPTYCASCTAFLPGAVTFGDFKACHKCFQQTCIKCKNPRSAHGTAWATNEGLEGCPVIDIPSEIAALIEKEEWSRCPFCKHVIEKTEGCDYMECICGENFCYKCGSAYDSDEDCDCPGDLRDENDEDDEGDLQEEGDEVGEWPQYAAAVDIHGRIRCMHELTNPLDDDGDSDGGRCHGCLREMPDIRSCETCHLELCSECLR